MRFALLSCIHANLAALEAVLRDAREMRCDAILCLGDIVGYHDRPKECLDMVRECCRASVKGNHDEYCSGPYPLDQFNPKAAKTILWTRAQLSPADQAWLGGLPLTLDLDGFTIVHASLDSPERWGYVFDKMAAAAHFAEQRQALCFNGHTHVAGAFQSNCGKVMGGTFKRLSLERGAKYLVNVGSVGQPRDSSPDAAYVVYDASASVVELRRVSYPRPPSGGHSLGKPAPKGGGPPKNLSEHNRWLA